MRSLCLLSCLFVFIVSWVWWNPGLGPNMVNSKKESREEEEICERERKGMGSRSRNSGISKCGSALRSIPVSLQADHLQNPLSFFVTLSSLFFLSLSTKSRTMAHSSRSQFAPTLIFCGHPPLSSFYLPSPLPCSFLLFFCPSCSAFLLALLASYRVAKSGPLVTRAVRSALDISVEVIPFSFFPSSFLFPVFVSSLTLLLFSFLLPVPSHGQWPTRHARSSLRSGYFCGDHSLRHPHLQRRGLSIDQSHGHSRCVVCFLVCLHEYVYLILFAFCLPGFCVFYVVLLGLPLLCCSLGLCTFLF